MKVLFFAICAFIFSALTAYSQELPQIPEQIKKFYSMEGTWEGEGTMTAGGTDSKGKSKYVWSKTAEGWGMYIDETVDIASMNFVYRGHNIFGYHMGENLYHLYTVDNQGDVHDHKGKMTDDKNLYLEYDGLTPDGKKYIEKLWMTFTSPTVIDFKLEGIVDGASAFTVIETIKKK